MAEQLMNQWVIAPMNRIIMWVGDRVSAGLDNLFDLFADLATIVGRKIIKFVLNLILLGFVVALIGLISVASYVLFRSLIVPRALLNEKLHFDFTNRSQPLARVDFLSDQRQWYYVTNQDIPLNAPLSALPHDAALTDAMKHRTSKGKRFLKYGNYYSVDVSMMVAKSPRNADLGKFMLYLTTYDTNKDVIAYSARPVVIPYQSSMTVYLDSIVLYPLRLMGIGEFPESNTVVVNVMSKYLEPIASMMPTQYLEFTLSTADVDVTDVTVTVMPTLRGFAYLMYYYPTASFVCGVALFFFVQFALLLFVGLAAIIYRNIGTNGRTEGNILREQQGGQVEGAFHGLQDGGVPGIPPDHSLGSVARMEIDNSVAEMKAAEDIHQGVQTDLGSIAASLPLEDDDEVNVYRFQRDESDSNATLIPLHLSYADNIDRAHLASLYQSRHGGNHTVGFAEDEQDSDFVHNFDIPTAADVRDSSMANIPYNVVESDGLRRRPIQRSSSPLFSPGL